MKASPSADRRGGAMSSAAAEKAAIAVREGKAMAEKRSREGGER